MVAAPIVVSPAARRKGLAALSIAAAFILGGAWMVGSMAFDAGRQIWQGRANRDWQGTTATVERSELIVKRGKSTQHIPHIVYRYEAGGRIFRSSVIEATPGYYRKGAGEVLAAYRPGMAVPVFHDGAGQSVLRQGVRPKSWVALVVGGGACLGQLALMVHLLKNFPRKPAG